MEDETVLGGWGLADRMAILSRQVDRLRTRLQGFKPVNPQDTSRLEDTRRRLVSVCARLKKTTETLIPQLRDRVSAENQWDQWVDLNRQFHTLAANCLALEQRVHLRADKDVAALCAIADRLAEGFSAAVGQPRPHYVLISEAEHFGADASAIHLGYGRLDIWSLNRVAHEFGHLWAEAFADGASGVQKYFAELLLTKKPGSAGGAGTGQVPAMYPPSDWTEAQAKEFFADIVAAFLMGPAYAFACFTLDFNPADDRHSDSHPSGHERAHCILIALNRMVESYRSFSKEELKQILGQLCSFWSATRAATGMPKTIKNRFALEYAIEIAVDRLVQDFPGAQYKSLTAANAVKNTLASRTGELPSGAGDVDVLNGAWLSRWVFGDSQEPAIRRGALEMLMRMSL
jgi:hypothetical protein